MSKVKTPSYTRGNKGQKAMALGEIKEKVKVPRAQKKILEKC